MFKQIKTERGIFTTHINSKKDDKKPKTNYFTNTTIFYTNNKKYTRDK